MFHTTTGPPLSPEFIAYVEEGVNWAIGLITPDRDVVAINLSFRILPVGGNTGDSYHTSHCAGAPASGALSEALLHGIQPVAAAGNHAQGVSFLDGIVIPACIAGVASVSATFDTDIGQYEGVGCVDEQTTQDAVVCSAQSAPILSLFAPGGAINIPGAEYPAQPAVATSFAAPHVAGVWAILSAAMPNATIGEMLDLLQATGVPITDDRLDPPRVTPRVDLYAALDADGDGVLFPFDNCSDKNEPLALCDADEDGFGNPCDCDIGPNGGNGTCTTADIDPFKDALTAGDPVADIDCSGAATTDDIPLFKTLLTEPQRPGPSGLPCAGEPPCN